MKPTTPQTFKRPTVNAPQSTLRIRGVESFQQQITRAKGIRAGSATEAAQLIPLIMNYLEQVGRYLGSMSRADAIMRTRRIAQDRMAVNGPVISDPVPTPEPIKEQPQVDDDDDDDTYSEEEEQLRVNQLKLNALNRKLRVAKIKKDTKTEKQVREEIEKLANSMKGPHSI